MICVAEKGYLTVRMTVETDPGHASKPPKETAIGERDRETDRDRQRDREGGRARWSERGEVERGG